MAALERGGRLQQQAGSGIIRARLPLSKGLEFGGLHGRGGWWERQCRELGSRRHHQRSAEAAAGTQPPASGRRPATPVRPIMEAEATGGGTGLRISHGLANAPAGAAQAAHLGVRARPAGALYVKCQCPVPRDTLHFITRQVPACSTPPLLTVYVCATMSLCRSAARRLAPSDLRLPPPGGCCPSCCPSLLPLLATCCCSIQPAGQPQPGSLLATAGRLCCLCCPPQLQSGCSASGRCLAASSKPGPGRQACSSTSSERIGPDHSVAAPGWLVRRTDEGQHQGSGRAVART